MENTKHLPRLSIGIIFRDNIRSIERCLKALQPLRDAVECQLIMADTGSKDGSREIAEQYADVLIDFPWIDDFAAARNAVVDLAEGEWFLTVDSDEYLDEDFSQLTAFLNSDVPEDIETASVTQRNYHTYEMDDLYGDFLAQRMFRVSAGLRYFGAIHETLRTNPFNSSVILPLVVLNHDGYVATNTDSKEGKAKLQRNITLLREELEKDPDDLRRLLQYIESGGGEQDLLTQLYHAVDLIKAGQHTGYDSVGASIMRYAVMNARGKQLPELEEWIALARKKFAKSYFTRIDIEYVDLMERLKQEDYEECEACARRLLKAYADYRKGGIETVRGQSIGVISMAAPMYEEGVRVILAKACMEQDGPEEAMDVLTELNCTVLEEREILNLVNVLIDLQVESELDTWELVRRCWEGLTEPVPSEEKARRRRAIFLQAAAAVFSPDYREKEEERETFRRRAYTTFFPLADLCEVGVGAALMETEDPAEAERLLRGVEKWNELPASAFSHALELIPAFPLPDKPIQMEEMDDLARRLSVPAEAVRLRALRAAEEGLAGSWQQLNWTRALVLAAVRAWGWQEGDEAKAMELARCFARLEQAFLPRFYAGEVLEEANVSALPPLHRFGWYCVRAFDALDRGEAPEYVRLLREALGVNRGMKPMVEFLTEHTPELQTARPGEELRELADKVRAMLAAYAPDDPAAAAIRQSEAYQKVAHLIEGIEAPVFGGLPS